MNRDVILFTGQSGISAKGCLKKLQEDGFKPPIAVEEHMIINYLKKHDPSFKPPESDEGQMRMAEVYRKTFLEILGLPPRIQESHWTEAFDNVKKKLPTTYTEGQPYVFVTFHASYYHQRKTEFLSPVDFRALTELKDKERVKMVVVFIDDCYDIYKRLMKKGEMFGYILESTPEKVLLDSITKNLLKILEWREAEIAFSRKIAHLLDVPLYVMAVKHSWRMLSRLIKSHGQQHIFYLSHPISSIRGGAYPRPPGFYEELCGFIRKMLAHDDVVLFIPDTIDEKRIRKDKNTGKYLPELSEGWPLPFSNEWLFAPLPSEVKDINPLNPLNFNVSKASDGFQTAISLLLEGLLEKIKIGEQINSRDLSLVEQSTSGVVVYRPFWAGVYPHGVEQELKYNNDLATQYGETTRKTAIIGADEDLAKWRIKNLFTQLEGNIVLDDTQKKTLRNLGEDWVDNEEKVSKFLNIETIKADKEKIKKCIEQVLPHDYKFKEDIPIRSSTTLHGADMLVEKEKQKDYWTWVFDTIPEEDPFRRKYISLERGDVYTICLEIEIKPEKWEEFTKEILKGGRSRGMKGLK